MDNCYYHQNVQKSQEMFQCGQYTPKYAKFECLCYSSELSNYKCFSDTSEAVFRG